MKKFRRLMLKRPMLMYKVDNFPAAPGSSDTVLGKAHVYIAASVMSLVVIQEMELLVLALHYLSGLCIVHVSCSRFKIQWRHSHGRTQVIMHYRFNLTLTRQSHRFNAPAGGCLRFYHSRPLCSKLKSDPTEKHNQISNRQSCCGLLCWCGNSVVNQPISSGIVNSHGTGPQRS